MPFVEICCQTLQKKQNHLKILKHHKLHFSAAETHSNSQNRACTAG